MLTMTTPVEVMVALVASAPKSTFKVAAIQLTSTTDVSANLERCAYWLRRAADEGARLALLPENFAFMGEEPEKLPYAAALESSAILDPLRGLCQELKLWVIAGGMPEALDDTSRTDRCHNTSVLLNPNGEIVARYRKMHLFDVDLADGFSISESAVVERGHKVVTADVEGWRFALSICYDLRFPELYRQQVAAGAEVLTVPAAFTLHTGKDHWDTLLRARAIENQSYLIAAGQFGRSGHTAQCWGKTQVLGPWGTCLANSPERAGVIFSVLEPDDLKSVRQQIPCLQHRVL